MKKIVRFPQIVQIIITPTPFALLWSVSEKVCLTKNTRAFVFEFLKDLSAQKQRVFQTNATLISTVRKTHAERYLCEIAVQIRNLKKALLVLRTFTTLLGIKLSVSVVLEAQCFTTKQKVHFYISCAPFRNKWTEKRLPEKSLF